MTFFTKKRMIVGLAVLLVAGVAVYAGLIGNAMQSGQFHVDTATISYDETLSTTDPSELKKPQFAGGCFWCVEADFEKVPGVIDVVSGYAGGTGENPNYGDYADTGHREVVEVTYDPNKVTYAELAEYLIRHIDPIDPDGSFYDRGYEYSSAIFYESEEEKKVAEKVIHKLDAMEVFDVPIVTPIEPIAQFWPAEEYHQDYYKKNPLKYSYYRNGSGRDDFVRSHWDGVEPQIIGSEATKEKIAMKDQLRKKWEDFKKPSEEELKGTLNDIQYKVTQKEGTERSFSNEYWDNKEEGLYVDIVSGEPLFSSKDKFDSGTGWPSFTKPISPNAVTEHTDRKLILPRTEIRSTYADSHLGHVFKDAPKELGGIRYCMNSAALRFIPKDKLEEEGYGDFLMLFE